MGLKGVAGINQSSVAITGGTITGITDLAVADGGTGASTAIAAAQNLSTPYVLAKWGVPVILASSGSMADNGAVSGMTALPTTYSGGAWLYLPAGAIAAGVPAAAAFYWFVASSTTAGTVYNSTFAGTSAPGIGTATAFSTTGPGAFTGVAAGEILAAEITVPAGAMGANGQLLIAAGGNHNTAAGNKIYRVRLGAAGTAHVASTQTTSASFHAEGQIINAGLASVQKASVTQGGAGGSVALVTYGTVDTASATTVRYSLEKATATNHVILEGGSVSVVYGA